MNAHDDHYNELELAGLSPNEIIIRVMEMAICTGIPKIFHSTLMRNLSNVLALKYQLRLGHKDSAEKELDKAANYIHRARTGRWIDGKE